MRFPMLTVLPLVLLLGCKPTPYRMGVQQAKTGDLIAASEYWLDALEADQANQKPRRALRDNASQAWQQHLDIAREFEAQKRYSESRAAYDTLLAFADRLESFELLSFPTDDAQGERRGVLVAWAASERLEGESAHERGQWADAVGHFETARELHPEQAGLDAVEGATYAQWAAEDLERHRYQDAADHYKAAYERTKDPAMDAWHASVEVALGRYALSKKACRAAAEHLSAAGDVVGDSAVPDELARARECARIGILMEPVDQQVSFDDTDIALGAMMMGHIERAVELHGTEHVRILAAAVLDSIDNPPRHQVKVTLTVNQASILPPSTTVDSQSSLGARVTPCAAETTLYDPDAICTEEVDVEYRLHRIARTVRFAGSIRTADLQSGEQSTRPLQVEITHDSLQATDFTLFEAGTRVPIEIGTRAAAGRIEVPDEVAALAAVPAPLPSASEMMVDGIQALGFEAAKAILAVVDREEPVAEPRRLAVRTPMLGADTIEFGQVQPPPTMTVQPVLPESALPDLDVSPAQETEVPPAPDTEVPPTP